MFVVVFDKGNSYSCNCCSNSYTETKEFESREEMINWLKDSKEPDKYITIEEIYDVKKDLSHDLKTELGLY